MDLEECEKRYGRLDKFAAEVQQNVTKQWEEEFEEQVSIKMKEERGKLEAAMERE